MNLNERQELYWAAYAPPPETNVVLTRHAGRNPKTNQRVASTTRLVPVDLAVKIDVVFSSCGGDTRTQPLA